MRLDLSSNSTTTRQNESEAHTWMVLQRSLAIRRLHLVCSRRLLDAQNLVRLNRRRFLILEVNLLFAWHLVDVVNGMGVEVLRCC